MLPPELIDNIQANHCSLLSLNLEHVITTDEPTYDPAIHEGYIFYNPTLDRVRVGLGDATGFKSLVDHETIQEVSNKTLNSVKIASINNTSDDAVLNDIKTSITDPQEKIASVYGIKDYVAFYAQPLDGDLTAISGLDDASIGFLKKTAANTWSLDNTTYIATGLSLSGHVSGSETGGTITTILEPIAISDQTVTALATDDTFLFHDTSAVGGALGKATISSLQSIINTDTFLSSIDDNADGTFDFNLNDASFVTLNIIEATQDIVAGLIQNGTGLSWTYDDTANTLTGNISLTPFDTGDLSEGTNLYFTDERVDNRVAALLVNSNAITLNYDDIANTLTIGESHSALTTNPHNVTPAQVGTYWNLKTDGVQRKQIAHTDVVDFIGGTNISLSYSAGGIITIDGDYTYTHPTGFASTPNPALTDLTVISQVTVNNEGHVTGTQTRELPSSTIQDGQGLNWTHDTVNNILTGDVHLTPFSTDDLTEGVSNLYFANERVDDRVATLIQNGTYISWSYNDTLNTLIPSLDVVGINYWTKAGNDVKYTAGNVIIGTAATPKDLTVYGNIYQHGGEVYAVNPEYITTSNDFILLRNDATTSILPNEISGIRITSYDGANNLIFGTDANGYFKVGERYITFAYTTAPTLPFTENERVVEKLTADDTATGAEADFINDNGVDTIKVNDTNNTAFTGDGSTYLEGQTSGATVTITSKTSVDTLQILATRADTIADNSLVAWDNTAEQLIDIGINYNDIVIGFTGLTDGYLPNYDSVTGKLENSPVYTTGTNVLIGTTTDNGDKLQVTGTAWVDGYAQVNGTETTVTDKNKTTVYLKDSTNNTFIYQGSVWDGSAWIASNNFGVGYYALENNTGHDSNGFGYAALANNTGNNSNGFGNAALLNNTGDRANGFGYSALLNNTGGNNSAIGNEAGYEQDALSGSDNTFLGANASYGTNLTITNSTAVGANVTLAQSNSVILGNGADVGIGTTTPQTTLDVDGTYGLSGTALTLDFLKSTIVGAATENQVAAINAAGGIDWVSISALPGYGSVKHKEYTTLTSPGTAETIDAATHGLGQHINLKFMKYDGTDYSEVITPKHSIDSAGNITFDSKVAFKGKVYIISSNAAL